MFLSTVTSLNSTAQTFLEREKGKIMFLSTWPLPTKDQFYQWKSVRPHFTKPYLRPGPSQPKITSYTSCMNSTSFCEISFFKTIYYIQAHHRSTFDICVVSWSIMTLLHPWTSRWWVLSTHYLLVLWGATMLHFGQKKVKGLLFTNDWLYIYWMRYSYEAFRNKGWQRILGKWSKAFIYSEPQFLVIPKHIHYLASKCLFSKIQTWCIF